MCNPAGMADWGYLGTQERVMNVGVGETIVVVGMTTGGVIIIFSLSSATS